MEVRLHVFGFYLLLSAALRVKARQTFYLLVKKDPKRVWFSNEQATCLKLPLSAIDLADDSPIDRILR